MKDEPHSIAEHLSELCKIQLSDAEKKTLNQSLKKVLDYTALLEEIDVEGVPYCTHILESMTNIMDEDVERTEFDHNIFTHNLPKHVGNMVQVPRIIEFEE